MPEGQTPFWLRRTVSARLLNGPLWVGFVDAAIRRSHRLGRMVPGATHLFEEAGALEQVAPLASSWFTTHLTSLRDTA